MNKKYYITLYKYSELDLWKSGKLCEYYEEAEEYLDKLDTFDEKIEEIKLSQSYPVNLFNKSK